MKLPRNLSGDDLIRALQRLGYDVTRQTGSHVRLTTTRRGEHHITNPGHSPLRVGTLAAILADIARHFETDRDSLLEQLFGGKH